MPKTILKAMKTKTAVAIMIQVLLVTSFVGLMVFTPLRQITNALPQWSFANPQGLGRLKLAWMAIGSLSIVSALAFSWIRKNRVQSVLATLD